ncbi:MAG: lysine 2,3-aminomutase [Alphaproteobacteria bacterium]|nr:lysine 2,3-aminomutase [Alphaproteobacteria bacterium]HCQ70696.1 lysine-2,3-aminomutase-like protein [Rhodospirillaceae bacterium]|tara:strand:+ start:24533 stop:25534 length:1002 start_codon:yes stop_codon:yes gene_type:complete
MTSQKIKQCDEMIEDRVAQHYAVGMNDHVRGAMRFHSPDDDPVARQYVPDEAELSSLEDELVDPIGDHDYSPVKGIVHRYPDRVLYKVTSVCPVYCRYCFRKTMVGPGQDVLRKAERSAALDYIRKDANIWEVIMTGGDPLMLSPKRLQQEIADLNAIDHVNVVRIHTRMVAADPERITDEMLQALSSGDKMVYLVMHVNHAQEITPRVQDAISRIRRQGIVALSQSVLLRGVNDDEDALESLFRGLVQCGVKPYMLHHLDRAPGTQHFRVSIARGQELMRALRGRVSGLCLPEYMLDIPGGFGKVPLTPQYCHEHGAGYDVTDYKGEMHYYE